jgi:MinD-like ATPase involved in chromosome partitioning or flagellar assembly
MVGPGDRTAVLMAAAGAPWESVALRELGASGVVVVKRCVDLADLMATAGSGQADIAVVSPDLPGLDAASVQHLLRHDVRTVAVGDEGVTSLARIGVVEVVPGSEVARLADAVRRAVIQDLVPDPEPDPGRAVADHDGPGGRVLAVWGPAGAPGRTTIAVSVAAELARRRSLQGTVVLADLDPYGGSVAQHLGVLDEVSGVLAAARLVNAGELDEQRFAGTRRLVSGRLELLTGLPRPDRWVEVRDGVVTEILDRASRHAQVVVDTGFSLEDTETDYGRPGAGRNRMTLEALLAADEVLVVGSADPVGLARLARGLVGLAETRPGAAVRVVVNRMRDSLGWNEHDISGMVEGFARPLGIHFLPDDRAACDRALVAGQALTETGDSPLRKAVAGLVDTMFPDSVAAPVRGGSRSGRRRGQAPKSR